jgi:hypothetical protein
MTSSGLLLPKLTNQVGVLRNMHGWLTRYFFKSVLDTESARRQLLGCAGSRINPPAGLALRPNKYPYHARQWTLGNMS